jgi:hypothetical protein
MNKLIMQIDAMKEELEKAMKLIESNDNEVALPLVKLADYRLDAMKKAIEKIHFKEVYRLI